MIVEGHATGPLISDAQIAALTTENGGILYSPTEICPFSRPQVEEPANLNRDHVRTYNQVCV